MKTFYVLCNGCPENRIDSAVVEQMFLTNGWPKASSYQEADLVLFNVCGQLFSELYSPRRAIELKQKEMKPGAELFVYGCATKIFESESLELLKRPGIKSNDFQAIAMHFGINEPKGSKANYLLPRFSPLPKSFNIRKLNRVLNPNFILSALKRKYYSMFLKRFTANYYKPDIFVISVGSGCLSNCSYCSHRISRGKLTSKPPQVIWEEFEQGLAEGITKFGLIGTDLGCYGQDIQTNLAQLLKPIVQHKGDFTLHLRNINPRFLLPMLDDFIEVLQSGRIQYLESAVQSGSDHVLSLMKRGYSVEAYREAMYRIREEAPHIDLRTQFIVNYPGETFEDFEASLNLMDEMLFDFIEVYNFRPETGSAASNLERTVSEKEAQQRYIQMLKKAVYSVKKRNHGTSKLKLIRK
jgi:tRNA A37 methylthiotransferase MiaB